MGEAHYTPLIQLFIILTLVVSVKGVVLNISRPNGTTVPNSTVDTVNRPIGSANGSSTIFQLDDLKDDKSNHDKNRKKITDNHDKNDDYGDDDDDDDDYDERSANYHADCNINEIYSDNYTLDNEENQICHDQYYDNYGDYGDNFIPRNVYVFFIYFIYILGLAGNIAVFVLMQRRFPRISYSVYIRFLAVTDSLVLITVCTEDILDHQFNKLSEFLMPNPWFCSVWTAVHSIVRLASPWYVVALTIDRFVIVKFPLKRMHYCTVKKALTACLLLMSVCVLQTGAILLVDFKGYCVGFGDENRAIYYYQLIKILGLDSGVPCVIIFVLNIIITINIRRSIRFRKSFGQTQVSRVGGGSSSEQSVTLTLAIVSLMAFCTLTPISVVEILESIWYETTHEDEPIPSYIDNASKTWPLLNLIRLFNFGQNFYVMLTSHKYRKEFREMLLINKCRRERSFSDNATAASTARGNTKLSNT